MLVTYTILYYTIIAGSTSPSAEPRAADSQVGRHYGRIRAHTVTLCHGRRRSAIYYVALVV